jgi:hypothetical protein
LRIIHDSKYECTEKTTLEEWGGVYVVVEATETHYTGCSIRTGMKRDHVHPD